MTAHRTRGGRADPCVTSAPSGVIFTDLDGTLLEHHSYDFSPAVSALAAAQEAGVPVVLCSSKTRAEMVEWQRRLGLAAPFIPENGGAVVLGSDRTLEPHFSHRFGAGPAKVLGTPYSLLRRSLTEMRTDLGLAVRGFGDMDLEEIALLTGLEPEDAERAARRDFDEPFLWDSVPAEPVLEALRAWLSERRLQVFRGGRLWHLVGGNDKGGAVRWLLRAFARHYGCRVPSLALGDSENDLPMLHAVARGVLVERPGGGHLPGAHARIGRVRGVGPRGWAREVERWLGEIDRKRSERTMPLGR